MNTEIILNGSYKLDITEDVNLLFTYQCGDIRKVLGRNSSYSKTISLIGSTSNNQAFSNLFDVRNYSDFNPNKKAQCIVISGGIKIFDGYLKVDSIKINNDNLISYECTMYSNVSDLFTELSNVKLNELDFSEFNHTYTSSAVTGSWDSYIYYQGQQTPIKKGFGYVYPYIDLGNDGSLTNIKYTEFFKPCFYAKTVLDKVFQQTDYTYKSSFFSSDYFKSLIIVPSPNSFTLPDLIISNAKLWASQEAGDTVDTTTVLNTYINNTSGIPATNIGTLQCECLTPSIYNHGSGVYDLNLPNTTIGGRYDAGNNFDVTLFHYTVPVTGYYNITANFNLDTSISNNSYSANSTTQPELHIVSQHTYTCSIDVTGATLNQYGAHPIKALESLTQVRDYDTILFANDLLLGSSALNDDMPNFDFNSGTPYPLNAGDKISIRVSTSWKFTSIKEFVDKSFYDFKPRIDFYQLSPSDMKIELMDNQIHEGMDWNFKVGYIGADQCSDYILSLAKMFNLYFEFDPDQDNTLIIEPRKDFYNGNVIDWTHKLDRSNEAEIFPMSEISSKNLHFLYRNDSDYWNDKYQKENLSTNKYSLLSQLTYGEYTYYLDNDFVDQSSEDKIDVIFAPTPLIQDSYYTSLTGGTYSASTKIISTAYQQEFDNNTGNLVKKPLNSFAPRILFYNGLLDCDDWGMYTYNKVGNNAIYANYLNTYSATTSPPPFIDFKHNTLTQYPYAGHLDNPFNPTQDLNFTYPAEYFYARNSVTSSNLFNNYWFDTVKDIEDKSAKLFTGYFHLTIADIKALSFRNVIYMDSSYWIINQIIDYCPLENSLTKVELIKLINYNQTQANINVTQQLVNLEPTHKILPVGNNPKNNTTIGGINLQSIIPPNRNIVMGINNTLSPDSRGNIVLGDNNMLPTGTVKSLIIGDGIGSNSQYIQSNAINVPTVNLMGETGTIEYNGTPVITFTSSGMTFPVTLQAISATTISATTYQNLPTDIYLTGGTYSAGTAVFHNTTGGTFSVSGFSTGGTSSGGTITGNYLPLSGGTVSGNVNVIGNLSGTNLYSGGTPLSTVILNTIAANPTLPAGANYQIQFNKGGNFYGSSNFTYDNGQANFSVGSGGSSFPSSTSSSILGGSCHEISATQSAAIIAGNMNCITYNSPNSSIIGGQRNTVQCYASNSGIFEGYGNILQASTSAIIAGVNNINCTTAGQSVVVGGIGNVMNGNINSAIMGGGQYNCIAGCQSGAAIIGGGNNYTRDSISAFMGGGSNNKIATQSQNSAVIGGNSNWIYSDTSYSAIIGGLLQ